MSQHDDIESIQLDHTVDFNYAGLRVVMGRRRQSKVFWECTESFVEIYWKDQLLCSDDTPLAALVGVFSAVRVCRPGIFELVGDDRTAILVALSALGPIMGVAVSAFCDTESMDTRLHLYSERVAAAIPSWDDRPTVTVASAMSSIDRQNFNNESIRYLISVSNHTTTLTHEVVAPVSQLPDLYTLVDDLVIKHFA